MQITRSLKGHTFSVQLRAVERAGQLANGAPAYTAHATIYRDGRDIGSARWDVTRFAYGPMALPGAHDNEDVYRELAVAIRGYLVTLPVEMPPADMSHPVQRLIEARMADPHIGPIVSVGMADDAATSMQNVTFTPGLRGDELRRMAGTASMYAVMLAGPVGAAWRALADALDAAAERDEAGNAPEAP